MKKIKKGDKVIVISGAVKNIVGVVESIDYKKNQVVIAGVNEGKKHVKPKNDNTEGGIISFYKPIHISNVMIAEGGGKKGDEKYTVTRIGFVVNEAGEKKRVMKTTKELI